MSGEFLTVTLAAGETKPFQKAGRYLEIIADGGGSVNLTFYGQNGAVASNWSNCQAGTFLEDPWTQFDVKNNSASQQTLVFLLMDSGRGGTRRQPGIVQVTYPVATSVQFAANIDTGTASALGFNLVRTLVAPAVNLKGVHIHSVALQALANAAGTSNLRLYAAPSAPAQINPPLSWFGGATGSTNGVQGSANQNLMNVTIPAGWGLYLVCQNSGTVPPQTIYSEICFEIVQ